MIVKRPVEIEIPNLEQEVTIWGLGDVHIGVIGCQEDYFQRTVDAIAADPYSFWVGVGDYLEGMWHRHKNFNARTLAKWIGTEDIHRILQFERDRFCEIVKPITGKCLGLVSGNHDAWSEASGVDLTLDICEKLHIPYLEVTGGVYVNIRATVGRQTRIFPSAISVYHGCGGAATPGGKINKIKKMTDVLEADVHFTGHNHFKTRCDTGKVVFTQSGKIKTKVPVGIAVGSFVNDYTAFATQYGEKMQFPPTALGASCAVLSVETKPSTQLLRRYVDPRIVA